MLRSQLLLITMCSLFIAATARADDELTPDKAKELIPAASGFPVEELQERMTATKPSNQAPSNGESLTWLILDRVASLDAPKNSTSFRFLGDKVQPAAFATALAGPKPKDKNGKYKGYVTVIRAEHITDCTCKVNGETATGTVTFKVDKVYEGKAEYTARKQDGKWRIEEFRLPDLKITTALSDNGKWVKK
jgi:hypothetical protein